MHQCDLQSVQNLQSNMQRLGELIEQDHKCTHSGPAENRNYFPFLLELKLSRVLPAFVLVYDVLYTIYRSDGREVGVDPKGASVSLQAIGTC